MTKNKPDIVKLLNEVEDEDYAEEISISREALLEDIEITVTQAMTGDVDGFYCEDHWTNGDKDSSKKDKWWAEHVLEELEKKSYEWFKETDDKYGWICDFAMAVESFAYDLWEEKPIDWKKVNL